VFFLHFLSPLGGSANNKLFHNPQNELGIIAKKPCATAKEPCATAKEPCATTKEPCATAKEPCATAKEPCATAKEPCAYSSALLIYYKQLRRQ